MLTFTTTGQLRNKFGEHLWPNIHSNRFIDPFRYVMNSDNSAINKKHDSSKRSHKRSTPFKLNLFSTKLQKKRRNF